MDSWNKSVKTVESYVRGRFERLSGPEDNFSLSDWKGFVTLTSLMKSSGAVLIGRDNGARSGALWSWIKEALSSSRFISIFTVEETCSTVSNLRIRYVSLGLLDAISFLVTRELMRLISPSLCMRSSSF